MDKLYYSMSNMLEDIDALVKCIELTGTKYDAVVGLSRGGLIPAVYLSHKLGIPMKVIEYSSSEGRGDKKNANFIPNWFYTMQQKFLIVDDIADTGHTLNEVMYGSPHDSFVLTYKSTSCYNPTFIGRNVDDHGWIDFFWENT